MFAREGSLRISLIYDGSGGDVACNPALRPYIVGADCRLIAEQSLRGTVMLEFGGSGPSVMVTAGVHGNEIPPQAAALRLVEFLGSSRVRGKVYLVPFAAPWSTMRNSRWFHGMDLNRSADVDGSVTNMLFRIARKLGVDAVGDFHSTAPGSRPGVEGVFCSDEPEPRSRDIAEYITSRTSSRLLCYERASSHYRGALEDECNLAGIPAVTCEVLSENGAIREGSVERSLLQMKLFLECMGIGIMR
ncbi:deacylase [Methanothermobacter sp. THM-1]|nr:deacylase [Methanothermobacter sp. THM-1]